jgi:hypothetical protein
MQIDIAKLAFDASKDHPEFPDDAEAPTGDELAVFERFAALVLEAAAVQCDGVYYQHIGPKSGEVRYGVAECAKAIRAMKPGESNE